jgi:uncharacterized protein (DUF111 family)
MARHLHIEPIGGMAGDMFLGACIDLGASLDDITAALAPLKLPCALTATPASRHSIGCTDFKVTEQGQGPKAEGHGHHHGHEREHHHNHEHEHHHNHDHTHDHHHVGYHEICHLIDHLDVVDRAKERARAIVTKLAEAEAAVHQTTIDKVHFHEVGAVDSIVDMLGAAVAVERLDIDTFSCASLPLGHGQIRCAHGIVPLPAPATVNILRGIPTHGVDRRCETVTPTGAAIVAALCTTFGPQPAMAISQIGYGAGDRDDADIANVVRVLMAG